MSLRNAVFNDFDFNAQGLSISEWDVHSRTPRKLQLEGRASADGAVLVNNQYGPKPILIAGVVRADSQDDLDMLLDTIKLRLSDTQGVLDLTHAGGTRRYHAVAENVAISQEQGQVDQAGYSVAFTVPSGYGEDTAASFLIASTTITTSSQTINFTSDGTYKVEPEVTVIITSATMDGETDSITLTNPSNSTYVSVVGVFEAGDVLTFNTQQRRVYLNSGDVFGYGAFPFWEPGTNSLTYSDTMSTRSVNLSANYKRRWL